MLRSLVSACVVVAFVTSAFGVEPLFLNSRWQTYSPYWGSVEPRINEGIPEFRIAGGSCVVSTTDMEPALQFEWFPEVDATDTLSVTVLSTGAPREEESLPFVPKDGITFTIGEGKLIKRIAYPDGRVISEEKVDERFNIRETEVNWHTIKVVREMSRERPVLALYLDDTVVTKIMYDIERLPGRRVAIGNKHSFFQNDQRIVPTSFIRKFALVK